MGYAEEYGKIRKSKAWIKFEELRNTLQEMFPELTPSQLARLASRVRNYQRGRVKELSRSGQLMYDYLLSKEYNPETVYKWFLIFIAPEDLQEDLKYNRVSQKRVLRVSRNRRLTREATKSWQFMQDAKRIVTEVFS